MNETPGQPEYEETPVEEDPASRAADTAEEHLPAEQQAPEAGLLARYRSALLASDPSIPAELVTGDTAEAIEASFAGARALVCRIRDELKAEAAQPVPAGAPGRMRAAPLTAFEKIRQGLGAKHG